MVAVKLTTLLWWRGADDDYQNESGWINHIATFSLCGTRSAPYRSGDSATFVLADAVACPPPISAAMARSDFSGLAAIALAEIASPVLGDNGGGLGGDAHLATSVCY
jgi:hypothetical protein